MAVLAQDCTQSSWSTAALALLCCLAGSVRSAQTFLKLKACSVALSACCFLLSFPPEVSVQHRLFNISLHPAAEQAHLASGAQHREWTVSTWQVTARSLNQATWKSVKSLLTLQMQNCMATKRKRSILTKTCHQLSRLLGILSSLLLAASLYVVSSFPESLLQDPC